MPKHANKKHDNGARAHKRSKAMLVICPTMNQWDTTSLIKKDFDAKGLVKSLLPFQTAGMEVVRSRLQYESSFITQIVNAEAVGALAFQLQTAQGYSDYATCFDQYRIKGIAVTFSPQYNFTVSATSSAGATLNRSPRLYTCFDYDDANTPTNVAYVEQYGSCIEAPPNTGVIRTLNPRVAGFAYGSGVGNAYSNMEAPWIDIASPNVYHYGIKYAMESAPTGQGVLQQYSVDVVMLVEFRSTR